MVRFGKNGSDARPLQLDWQEHIQKEIYQQLTPHHGWHDWYAVVLLEI